MLARTYTLGPWRHSFPILALAALLAIAILPISLSSQHLPNPAVAPTKQADYGKLPLSFEPNAGQTDPSVRFMAHASGGTLYFSPSEVVLALQDPANAKDNKADKGVNSPPSTSTTNQHAVPPAEPKSVRLHFLDANPAPQLQSGSSLPGKVNYFLGNDPAKWHTNLPTYGSVVYTNLYPGIDLTYEGTNRLLKGTYTVAPGADPTRIHWRYEGANKVSVDEAGNLQISVQGSSLTLTEQAPVAWQEIDGKRVDIKVRYSVGADESVGFEVERYDKAKPLVIDPTLVYSTYFGGNGDDDGRGIAVDGSGNVYIAGHTTSTNFYTLNPYQPINAGNQDAFVSKLNASGTALIYSTYLGGSGMEITFGIAVDTNGNAYVTGFTYSTDFPTANPIQPTFHGTQDLFISKLNANGSSLAYSTYLGGSGYDDGINIAVDAGGNAYVVGASTADFPTTPNALQPNNRGGGHDAIVVKLNPSGSALIYSTYLGGTSDEQAFGIAVDSAGNAYISGLTSSTDFPTANPLQSSNAGGWDAFITKLNSDGTAILYSTYLGGSGYEQAPDIAVDGGGNAYIIGRTNSSNFPRVNPYQASFGGGPMDAFVSKLNPSGSALVYSTYLGGTGDDNGYDIAVNPTCSSGCNAFITGWTNSLNFPTANPIQPTEGGGYDAFVSELSSSGSALVYSTYLGGSGDDNAADQSSAIAVDSSNSAYVTGWTVSTDFPTANPIQANKSGGKDAFIAKISDQPADTPTITPTNTPTNTPTPQPTATCIPQPSGMVAWYPGDGNANDIQGGHNGTLQNGASFAPGVVDQGFHFDGVDDYLEVPDDPSLTPQQFTVDAWVRFDSFYSGTCHANEVVGKGNDGTLGSYSLRVVDPGGYCGGPTGQERAMVTVRFADGVPVNLGGTIPIVSSLFYHLAGTWDGNTLKVYVNGNLDGQVALPGKTLGSNTLPLSIGRHNVPGYPYTFQGVVDEVQIFNRALTDQEILNIYNAGSAGICKQETPTPIITDTPTDTPTNTQTFTHTPTYTLTDTPTNTPTFTHTPTTTAIPIPTSTALPILVGHVTWQGLPPQQQQMAISLTLKMVSTEVNYPMQLTDTSGFFTVTLGSLPNGSYIWRVKGPNYLANIGTIFLTGAPITNQDMGLMKAGDINSDNVVNVLDFNTLRTNFSLGGAPPANPRGP